MKIIKPLRLSMLNRAYRFRQKNFYSVAPVCFFDLVTGEIITEAAGWKKVMAVPGMENGFDIAMPKKTGEFLAMGKACAPKGEETAGMDVSIRLGDIEKALRVTGDREWKTNLFNSAVLSLPELFTEKNLTWANAYGGKRYADNPAGKGFEKRYRLLTGFVNRITWPNIEDPLKPLKKPGKRYTPQSFGMVDITSKKRRKKAGTYDKKWLKNDYPGYPEDIDWSIFNAACEKQWNTGFFDGDETFEITGMHPEKQIIKGALPKIRTRAFISQEEGRELIFREVDTRLDTVWFFPDIETGILIFRGTAEIDDSDALDIKSLLFAYENMADSKRPASYYRDAHDKRIDIKTAPAHVFNESQLSPEKSARQKKMEADEQIRAEKKDLEVKQKAIEAAVESFPETTGVKLPESFEMPVAEPSPIGIIPPEALKRNDFDLSGLLENVETLTQKLMEEGKKKLEEMELEISEEPTETKEAKIIRLKKTAIKNATEKVGSKETEALLKLMKGAEQDAAEIEEGQQYAGKQMPELRRLSPDPLYPEEEYPAEVAHSLRGLVLEIVKKGDPLHDRDFAGGDLKNIDFSGLDMSGVMLEKADLSGCTFLNTNLENAVLNSTVIDNTDFSGALMTGVNLCNSTGKKSIFRGCDLTGAYLTGAVLKEADFTSSVLINVIGLSASIKGSYFSGCRFEKSLFIDAELDETDFSGSIFNKCIFTNSTSEFAVFRQTEMTKCALVNIAADGSDFSETIFRKCQIAGDSFLRSCNFSNTDARESGFRNSDFSDSCFNGGALIKSDLGNVSFKRSSINETVFSKSIMMKADLGEAVIKKADFFEALLRKADFSNSDLDKTSFYCADLSEVVMPEKSQMKGINR